MSSDQKKENQKKRLAQQLRTNLMRRKAQAKKRTSEYEDITQDSMQDATTGHHDGGDKGCE